MGSMGGVTRGGGLALAILCLASVAVMAPEKSLDVEEEKQVDEVIWDEDNIEIWEEYVDYDYVNIDRDTDGDGLRDHVDDSDDDNDGIPDLQDDDDDGDGIRDREDSDWFAHDEM